MIAIYYNSYLRLTSTVAKIKSVDNKDTKENTWLEIFFLLKCKDGLDQKPNDQLSHTVAINSREELGNSLEEASIKPCYPSISMNTEDYT